MSKLDKHSNNKNKISIQRIDNFPHGKEGIYKTLTVIKEGDPDIVIIGDGDIGDKARGFIEKTDKIHETGFKTTKKIMLGSDISGQCEYDEKFLNNMSHAVSSYYKNTPVLIVRSSGQGDAKGIGIYKSNFTINNPKSIAKAIKKTNESNHSGSAVEYRRIAGITNNGMGICIEPCIGNHYEDYNYKYFGPELSGRGRKEESGTRELGICSGIGGGVESRECYPQKAVYHNKSTLYDVVPKIGDNIMDNDRSSLFNPIQSLKEKPVSLLIHYLLMDSCFVTSLYNIKLKTAMVTQLHRELKKNLCNYPLGKLLKSMDELEKKLKSPQYLERVALYNKGKFDTYITQIADQVQDTISINLEQDGNCILQTHYIVRSGMKDFDKVLLVVLPERFGMSSHCDEFLLEYNKNNKNYLLLISDKVTYGERKLSFEHFSNANGIIEIPSTMGHLGLPSSHYRGLLEATNILFGVADKKKINNTFKNLASNKLDGYGIFHEFTNNKFRLVQDAKKGVGKLFLLT